MAKRASAVAAVAAAVTVGMGSLVTAGGAAAKGNGQGPPIKIGYIGMTLEATDTLVSQAGIEGWDFTDEVETANALVPEMKRKGIEAIVLLVHEGGIQTGGLSECRDASGPILDIAENLHPEIDLIVSGHTHQPYVCSIDDPDGNPRLVTSAFSFGRLITETQFRIDPATRDVVRSSMSSTNHVVSRDVPKDPAQTAVLDKWAPLAAEEGSKAVGTITADITRAYTGTSEDRSLESDLGNLIADAQLAASKDLTGAQIAFMNPGGIRADLAYAQSGSEGDGVVTYAEAFAVQPFSNILQTMTLTGTQIDEVLEQQWVDGRSRYRLHLGVSEGFTYSFDESQPEGSRIDIADISLNGAALEPAAEYRVTVNSFLADGGDDFSAFTNGTDRTGGGIDLDEFIAYLGTESPVAPPGTDRVAENFCPPGTSVTPAGCSGALAAGIQMVDTSSQGPSLIADRAGSTGVNKTVTATGLPATTEGVPVQILSFNDYHGHLEPDSGRDAEVELPDGTVIEANGGEYLATHLQRLRAGNALSYTVTAGDNIGGAPFLSSLFRHEPTIESLEALGLDVTGVGNHEFDAGIDELRRMQNGGCHPVDGCYFPNDPYDGADFPMLAANVVPEDRPDKTLFRSYVFETLPPGQVKKLL